MTSWTAFVAVLIAGFGAGSLTTVYVVSLLLHRDQVTP